MSNDVWMWEWRWRAWTFGVVFGPEVFEIHIGPFAVSRLLDAG